MPKTSSGAPCRLMRVCMCGIPFPFLTGTLLQGSAQSWGLRASSFLKHLWPYFLSSPKSMAVSLHFSHVTLPHHTHYNTSHKQTHS